MSDNNIDPKRQKDLRRKYQMDDAPQPNNPVVAATSRTDEMYGLLFTRDSTELFDPVRNPQMYEVARRALSDLHAAMVEPADSIELDDSGRLVSVVEEGADGRITADSDDGPFDPFTPLDPGDPALYIYFVGDNATFVVRGPKQLGAFDLATRGPARPRRGVEYFRGMLQAVIGTHRLWDASCNVRVSRSCGGPTQLLPYRAGAFLLLFEVCEPCFTYAEAATRTGYELSVMEAHARVGLPFP